MDEFGNPLGSGAAPAVWAAAVRSSPPRDLRVFARAAGRPPWMAARIYYGAGLHPIPVCAPDPAGPSGCTAGWHDHRGAKAHSVGKAPVVRAGGLLRQMEWDGAPAWTLRWSAWREANVAIALRPSGLAVVDLDSREAVEEAEALGLPPGPVVRRGDHVHRYYLLPPGAPATRATRRGRTAKIDILSAGYTVAPPSVHASGERYELALDAPLSPLPGWAVAFLEEPEARRAMGPAPGLGAAAAEGAPRGEGLLEELRRYGVAEWCVRRIVEGDARPDGARDRSGTDWAVTRHLVERGVPERLIAAVYLTPGWGIAAKFRERRDPWKYLGDMLAKHRAAVPPFPEPDWAALAEFLDGAEAAGGLPPELARAFDPETTAPGRRRRAAALMLRAGAPPGLVMALLGAAALGDDAAMKADWRAAAWVAEHWDEGGERAG
ncbi:MAG: bifunctional DNA primase/polymerase [Bacillota bacterium]|nr:bifunctional DNA primase/polymerase [Bacillota bacterium]